jgi:glucose-1-phosphatase
MPSPIKNIIFDFGGVIIPVDTMAYASGMISLGCKNIAGLHEQFVKNHVYMRFEKGRISPDEFRALLRTGFDNPVSDEELDHAWNLMIGEIPPHRVKFLESIRDKYRLFLLSNSNKIHFDYYNGQFIKAYGYSSLNDLFERAYYSFMLKLYKPDPAIFEYVLTASGLNPSETMFIDDNQANVEAANKLGIQGIHLSDGMEVAKIITTLPS